MNGQPITSAILPGERQETAKAFAPESPRRSVPSRSTDSWKIFVVSAALAAMTWFVFGQTLQHAFVNFDDDLYVYENPMVAHGVTLPGIESAFTEVHASNWHPLTWISHMLDSEFYGLNPKGHHLTNVLLHATTVVLLFSVLRQLTAAFWRSAFVAAVFAIHPLRVESVAWIAERKDVLSGLFFVLTIAAYVRYVRGPRSLGRYLVVVAMFVLALLSKPMVVTLPFVLLLLDYWPLQRFPSSHGRLHPWRLIAEKLPLLVLSGAACAATLFAQTEAITPSPFRQRIGNALVAYAAYLEQMILPTNLAVYYPFPGDSLPLWKPTAALILLVGISAFAIAVRRSRPWLLFGWLWFLGTLVPVIGLLQVGSQAHADRYTYLPHLGIVILLTWTAAEACAGWRHRQRVLGGFAGIIVLALLFSARAQAAYWRDSESLWTRALACTSGNVVAHDNLGHVLLEQGRVDEAIVHFEAALRLSPVHIKAHNNLGNALLEKNRASEAIAHYRTALQLKPDYAEAHNNLGIALAQSGNVDEAIDHFENALRLSPDYAFAHNNLGQALLQKNDARKAITHFEKALALKPDYAEAHHNLGMVFLRQDRFDEAIPHFQAERRLRPNSPKPCNTLGFIFAQQGRLREATAQYRSALELQPDNVRTLSNLAWVLATCPEASIRNGTEAIQLAGRANDLSAGEDAAIQRTLAAALAEGGRFSEAVTTGQHALKLARSQSDDAMAEMLESQIKLYQSRSAFRDASLAARSAISASP
jgi:tetratricopeptide (TPR) repeat protein